MRVSKLRRGTEGWNLVERLLDVSLHRFVVGSRHCVVISPFCLRNLPIRYALIADSRIHRRLQKATHFWSSMSFLLRIGSKLCILRISNHLNMSQESEAMVDRTDLMSQSMLQVISLIRIGLYRLPGEVGLMMRALRMRKVL